jgi:hypothetical protein
MEHAVPARPAARSLSLGARRSGLAALVALLGLCLAACGSPEPPRDPLPMPVAAARDVVSSSGGAAAPATYDVTPGTDGRVFLVLDCVGRGANMTASRADGLPWSPPHLTDGSPTAAVSCTADGARLALLVTGDAGVPVPLVLDTGGASEWRVSQTEQSPNHG